MSIADTSNVENSVVRTLNFVTQDKVEKSILPQGLVDIRFFDLFLMALWEGQKIAQTKLI